MAQNLVLDPKKKDYVFDKGSPIPSDRVLEASYYALMIPQGKYLYEEQGQGSLIHTLQGIKRRSDLEQQFSSYAKEAIDRQVIKSGQATNVDVENLEATKTGTSNRISVTPTDVQPATEISFVSV